MKKLFVMVMVLLCFGVRVQAGPEPIVGIPLTRDQMLADWYQLVQMTTTKAYSGVLEHKKRVYGINIERTIKQFEARIRAIEPEQEDTNHRFYEVLRNFIAIFGDGHRGIRIVPAPLPGRVKLALLGFSGVRVGENLYVTHTMPITGFPIAPGDEIAGINGMTLREYVNRYLVPQSNVGQEESNLTIHMNSIFNRISATNGLPEGNSVRLKVKKAGGSLKDIDLNWIRKDMADIVFEQQSAIRAFKEGDFSNLLVKDFNGMSFHISFTEFDGLPWVPASWRTERDYDRARKNGLKHGLKMLHTFRSGAQLAELRFEQQPRQQETPQEQLMRTRPMQKYFARLVETAQIFPAAIFEKDGKKYGVLRLRTFAPNARENDVLDELDETLAEFQRQGVEDILIDMLNNGGGSLSLVLQMAQRLSPKQLEMPLIQLGVNENWYSQVETGALYSTGEHQKIQQHLLALMKDALKKKQNLTPAIPVEALLGGRIPPNSNLRKPFNLVLFTNEMCASAADIFAYIFKRNKMGISVGSQTMGAGGNVVVFRQLLQAHVDISETLSLLIGRDEQNRLFPLEDNGIQPHIPMDVTMSSHTLYDQVYAKGLEALAMMGERDIPSVVPFRPSPTRIQPSRGRRIAASLFPRWYALPEASPLFAEVNPLSLEGNIQTNNCVALLGE